MFWIVKKVLAVLATSMLMIDKKTEEKLDQILYIWYLVTFKDQIEALLDLKSKVNAISQTFARPQDLKDQHWGPENWQYYSGDRE